MTTGPDYSRGSSLPMRLLIEDGLLPDPCPELSPATVLNLGRGNAAGSQRPTATVTIVTQPQDLGAAAGSLGYYVPGTHCRQGDILSAVAASARPVWIERGSFLSPMDLAHITERFGSKQDVTIVESGSSFGYDDRVLDLRALALYEAWGLRVALGVGDLCLGDGASSGFRPSWAIDQASRARFAKTFLRVAEHWGCDLVLKSPVLLKGAATDVAIAAACSQLAAQICEHLVARKQKNHD